MTTLTVGRNQQYQTISSAVLASHAGDVIAVSSGMYVNDFISITHDLVIEAVNGPVFLSATTSPPNGKGIIDEGGPGVHVTLSGLDISGATVPDANGAGVRYEGGTLDLVGVNIHDNQNGILANSDPAGVITIRNSTFTHNGGGTGNTHNIYVGTIASLTVQDSVISAANVGHDIKSRAAATTILRNVITDGTTGNSSYEIDLPNGGIALVQGNIIQKGPLAENPTAIAFGEEGGLYSASSLTVTGNTLLNDYTAHNALTVWNATTSTATMTGNALYGWKNMTSGPVALAGNTALTAEPALSALAPAQAGATLAYTDVTAGQSGTLNLLAPTTGGPSYLQNMYIWSSSNNVAMSTTAPNAFLKGGTGSDALKVTSGQNVLDGGAGSNFLVGGSGTDTFFVDARGNAIVWSTIVNFHASDAVTLWGFVAGTSTYTWETSPSGAAGYEGATLRGHIDGSATTTASLTFAGMDLAQAQALRVSTGTAGGVPYLYLTL